MTAQTVSTSTTTEMTTQPAGAPRSTGVTTTRTRGAMSRLDDPNTNSDHAPWTEAGGPRTLTICHKDEDMILIREALETLDLRIERISGEDVVAAPHTLSTYAMIVVVRSSRVGDGLDLCRRVRDDDARIPIVILDLVDAHADTDGLAAFAAGPTAI